jgi:DNA-binding LytR/AlgR family response regulator
MKVVIIEDEKLARDKIKQLLHEFDSTAEVLAELDSVENAVHWLKNNSLPDVLFVDIHLADGISFDIFEQIDIRVPVIFTTAYNEYALRAFDVNSIDYLLKPIQYDDLAKSLNKLNKIRTDQHELSLKNLKQLIQEEENHYKERFVAKIGDNIQTVETKNILYFYTEFKGVYLVTENHRLLINYTLEEIEDLVDLRMFFRLNRKYIASFKAINKIKTYFNSRLQIDLQNSDDEEILVSRERVNQFKNWLDQ